MGAAIAIAACWLAFAGSHMLLASRPLRPRLVERLGGEQRYLGVFTLVAFATLAPLVWVYFAHKHSGPLLWYGGQSAALRGIAHLGMAAAFSLIVGGVVRPSPVMKPGEVDVRGMQRITRHPIFMGVGLFGAVHLLAAAVNLSELVFFAGFPAFAVIGCRHQDRRKLASGDEAFARFHAATPFLPFTGPARLRGLSESAVAIAIGVAIALLVRWLHPAIFGGAFGGA